MRIKHSHSFVILAETGEVKLFKKNKSDKGRSPLNEQRLRYAGESLDKEIRNLQHEIYAELAVFLFLLAFSFLELWLWFTKVPRQPIFAVCLAVVVIVWGYIKIGRLKKQLNSMILGLEGEKEVGQVLEQLREDGCAIFHDIICDDFNIDHVIISPHGIFVVETKTRTKPSAGVKAEGFFDGQRVILNGKPPDDKPVLQANRNADWIRNKLLKRTENKYRVTPVLVYPGWYFPKDMNDGNQTWVMNPGMLRWQIREDPQVFSEEEIRNVSFYVSQFYKI
jgi:hypothetical protein